MAFLLPLFVSLLYFFWCLGKRVLFDFSISRVSSFIFVLINDNENNVIAITFNLNSK